MNGPFVELAGEAVAPSALRASKARELARRLEAGALPYARLVECRRADPWDVLIFDVEVEFGQVRAHDVRPVERIAACFTASDGDAPEVLALRADFPAVPHLYLRAQELPRSLCLFDERYRDLKPHWTASMFIERVRTWLRLTARGELHAEDQPLEPLLLDVVGTIILPHDLFGSDGGATAPIAVTRANDHRGRLVLMAERAASRAWSGNSGELRFLAVAIRAAAREHGIIRHTPQTLRELHDLLTEADDDLLGIVRERLFEWKNLPGALDARLVLIISMPKMRSAAGSVEATDVWAFVTMQTIREVGVAVGRWEVHAGSVGALIPPIADHRGDDVKLDLLSAVTTLSRERAAYLNGRDAPSELRMVAVGCGTLGSQVVMNAARGAFGRWTVIDDDILLPHNLARHALDSAGVGWPKAQVVSWTANQITGGGNAFDHVVADVLEPGQHAAAVAGGLAEADVIVDMSASVTVTRHLARGLRSGGRRVSLFLNPTGTDITLLAEDRERRIPLDALEMQYYRALLVRPELAGHLHPPPGRVRYGRSCRDVSVRLSQELVGLQAAVGARALRAAVERDSAEIAVWRADPETFAVTRHAVEPRVSVTRRVGAWTLVTDEGFLETLAKLRGQKLPRETGGVLLGAFDLERKIVYVADAIPSPPDSEEWPVLYIRGCKGLSQRVNAVVEATAGQVHYVGEWHSHPNGYACRPSEDDGTVFGWLTEHMDAHGLPALMMIAGEGGEFAVFLGCMVAGEALEDVEDGQPGADKGASIRLTSVPDGTRDARWD